MAQLILGCCWIAVIVMSVAGTIGIVVHAVRETRRIDARAGKQ